jgi:tetratricopeptide (TPR) repeat protein
VKTHTAGALFLILACFSGLRAQNLRDPHFVALAESGFAHLLNQDYDKAEQVFVSLEKENPQHPAPPLYQASIHWLKEMERRQDISLNRFIVPAYFYNKTNMVMPPRERTDFFAELQKSENLSKGILQKDRFNKDARYFMATVFGLRASFAITIDHSLREAFSNGNKSYSYAKQLVDEDPKYYDAYLALGIYEYTVGLIPWYMRWMIFVVGGGRGSKEDGLAHLKLATENGEYVKDQAKVVSMVLNVREQHYAEALEQARDLAARFSRSYLFPINVAQILRLAGQNEESIPLLLQVEKRAENREPNFDRLPLANLRFNLGTEFMHMGKLDLAKERFVRSISDPQITDREKALSHLCLGQIHDWQGQRTEAIKECQTVLSLEDVENSHDQAKKLLSKLKRR